ncbi:MAG: hypothetical protein U0326_13020 [Polyangiales bacterium]
MPSKEVTDRAKSAGAVVASIEAHAPAASAAIEGLFKRVLRRGETMPDVAFTLALFGRLLKADSDALVAADDAHEDEKADDAAPRRVRDASAARVREGCVHARDGVSTVYGEAALRVLGMGTAPPAVSDGAALVRWATAAATKLEDVAVVLPKPVRRGVSIDRAALAEGIREKLSSLSESIADVERERRELEATQAAKNSAAERNDRTFALVANVASAVFDAAGMPDQAAKVRPSVKRPGRVEDADGPPDDGGGTGTQ